MLATWLLLAILLSCLESKDYSLTGGGVGLTRLLKAGRIHPIADAAPKEYG